MASIIQVNYQIYQQRFFVGQMPYAKAPYHIIKGPAQVPANGRKPRPGDTVYWDATNDGFAAVASAANQADARGIVVYDAAEVQSMLSSVPSGANSDLFIEYDDGDTMKICLFGHVAVVAGAAVEREAGIVQDTTDRQYDAFTKATAIANIPEVGITAETAASAAGDIIIARIGYGRVN